jgi:hypothetical protein
MDGELEAQDLVQDANQPEVESSPIPEVKTEPSADGAAKPVLQEEPFHKHPRFQQEIKKRQSLESELRELRGLHQKMLEQMAFSQKPREEGPKIDPNTLRDAEQLAEILLNTPKFSSKFGESQRLNEEIARINEARMQEQAEGEFNSCLENYASKYALDKAELREEVQEYIKSSPYFDKAYHKGQVDMAFKAVLFPKISELKERELNLKSIQERTEKKAMNQEQVAVGSKSKNSKLPSRMSDYLTARMKEEGGEIDMDA